MMRIISYLVIVLTYFCVFAINIFSQQEDYQLGLNQGNFRQTQGAYYDYSDPDGLNIKVSVWGYVKFPGRYIIPVRSDIRDLISYAGGINDDAYLDEIRVYKVLPDSSQEMLKFNYDDLWWNENLTQDLKLYRMDAGDVLVVPGRNRLYWENYLSLGLSIVGVLISLTTLIVTVNK